MMGRQCGDGGLLRRIRKKGGGAVGVDKGGMRDGGMGLERKGEGRENFFYDGCRSRLPVRA
jgi:hypothetical protein